MNWSTSKSILLSRICVAIFALLLAALDLGAYWLVTWYIHLRGMAWQSGAGDRDAVPLQHLRLGAALADVDSAEQHPQE